MKMIQIAKVENWLRNNINLSWSRTSKDTTDQARQILKALGKQLTEGEKVYRC